MAVDLLALLAEAETGSATNAEAAPILVKTPIVLTALVLFFRIVISSLIHAQEIC